MEIQPVLAALRRHRTAAFLIACEIALACAVLCNACFLIANRVELMKVVSGVDEASLAFIRVTGYEPGQDADINARLLAGLRQVPGVQSASAINSLPFGPRRGTAGITLDPEGQHMAGVVDFYTAGPGAFQALGLHVVAGRAPQEDDFRPAANFLPQDSNVLVTRALASHLWPHVDPLGREFWLGHMHFRVTGVLDHLVIPQPGSRGEGSAEFSVFVPTRPGPALAGSYLLRAEPRQLQRVLRDASATVQKLAPELVLDTDATGTVPELREAYFQQDRSMAGMLVGVIVALLLVTALGIVGLASFWVAQRRKQIGVRRALGATRRDILRYFQTENFLIVSLGIALGMGLAFGLNLVLMAHYEIARLPFYYLPAGALALWLLGQLAVLAPALRAAAVPPVVATRSV